MKQKKPINFSGKLRYLAYGLILLLIVTCNLFFHQLLAQNYFRTWFHYGVNWTQMTLRNLNPSQSEELLDLLEQEHPGLAVIHRHRNTLKDYYPMSLAGDPEAFEQLDFHGVNLLDASKVDQVINHGAIMYNGSEARTQDKIIKIPTVKMTWEDVQVQSMRNLLDDYGSLNGSFHLRGDSQVVKAFADEVAKITNKKTSDILGRKRYFGFIDGPDLKIYAVATGLLSLSVIFVILIMITHSYSTWSSLALLGWSKSQFLFQLLRPILLFSIIAVIITPLFSFLLGMSYQISWTHYFYYLVPSLACLLYILLCCLIGSSQYLTMSPIKAIKKQYSLKTLYWLTGLGYLSIALITTYAGIVIEGPILDLAHDEELRSHWQQHSALNVITSIEVGDDLESFNHDSDKFTVDFWKWYQSIAQSEDVLFFSSHYISQEEIELAQQYGIDRDEFFTEPIWEIKCNPQYLTHIGVKLSPSIHEEVEKGNLPFLIPNHWEESKKEHIKNIITASEIDTAEFQIEGLSAGKPSEIEYIFIDYPLKNIFTWSKFSDHPKISDEVVIGIVNDKTMSHFNVRELSNAGLESRIKFSDPDFAQQVTQEDYLAKYNLDDNLITLSTVQKLLDQTKESTLRATIVLFFIILLFLAINALFLNSFISIYRLSHYEELFVSYLMGITNHQRYRIIFIFWLLALIGQQVLAYFTHSKFASLLSFLTSLIFILYILFLTRESDLNRYKQSGKE